MRPKWTARSFATGRLPGSPRQTAHACVFGSSPKDSSQPQNILVAVRSCTWISSPITGSSSSAPAPSRRACALSNASDTRASAVEAERLLERVRSIEHPVLAERGAADLKSHRQALAEPARDRQRGYPCQRHRHGAVVAQVHRQRIRRALAELEGHRRGG